MAKLIALLITLGLFIFGNADFGLFAGAIFFFMFFFSWIIKSNKQRSDESDEDYAKRMERLKITQNKTINDSIITNPSYWYLPQNIYYKYRHPSQK